MIQQPQNDAGDVTEAIRSGAYFQQARSWYFTLFSNPVTERSFFFGAFSLALLTMLIALIALVAILPLKERTPFMTANDRIDETVLRMIKLREHRKVTPDEALMRFYASSYTKMRESYSQEGAALSEQFVANYSDPAALQSYLQMMDAQNPSSPKLLFRDPWMKRVAEPLSVRLNLAQEPYQALVRFRVLVFGKGDAQPVSYTADIRFSYSPLQAVEELDSVTGRKVTRFTKPKFQVVSYNVQPSAAK